MKATATDDGVLPRLTSTPTLFHSSGERFAMGLALPTTWPDSAAPWHHTSTGRQQYSDGEGHNSETDNSKNSTGEDHPTDNAR